jgi:pimeloyl-ACP methyl ester carboxylesterase
MQKSPPLAAVLTAAAALVVPGVSAAAPAPTVTWVECPADVAAPGVECGTLQVPLDYRAPGGRRIELMISRLASKNPEKRRGILLTNPGGPGEGLTFPADLRFAGLPQDVQDAYDVIGVDPRGIGRSTPVTCDLTEEQQFAGSIPPYAVTPADVREHAGEVERIARQCTTSSTAYLLPHNTTANIARDLDRIRAALGEPKASFLGYSYGTYLGAVYTTLFPRTTDRVVIDSNLGAGGWDVEGGRMFARGMEDAFPDFADWAAAHPEFGLGGTSQQVRAKYFDLAGRLDGAPVQGVTGSQFSLYTFASLYGTGDAAFTALAEIWKALDTDATLPPSDTPVPPRLENTIAGRLHVICGDSRWPTSVRSYGARCRRRPRPLPAVRGRGGQHPAVRLLAGPRGAAGADLRPRTGQRARGAERAGPRDAVGGCAVNPPRLR